MKHTWLPVALLLWACNTSQKVYTAPAMGAEAQFEKGLRPEKHPKYLFDKKTMKDMQRQGTAGNYSGKRRSTAPTIPLPGKSGSRSDSTALPGDSTATQPLPADSTRPAPVPDSTHTRSEQ